MLDLQNFRYVDGGYNLTNKILVDNIKLKQVNGSLYIFTYTDKMQWQHKKGTESNPHNILDSEQDHWKHQPKQPKIWKPNSLTMLHYDPPMPEDQVDQI